MYFANCEYTANCTFEILRKHDVKKLTRIVMIFMTKMSNKYLAISGIVDEVGGKILEMSKRNTTNASIMLMARIIFSLASAGR